MEAMKQFPDKFFDLAIVDVPYGVLDKQGGRIDANFKANKWDIKPTKEYFDQLFRISQNQIIWGANNFILPETEYFIVWDKMQTVDNFASAEYAWTNCKIPAKVFRYSIHKEMADRKQNGGKIHPTQKPVALYIWLLQNYAKKGDKILDTHVGSASSLIACHKLGFEYWGFELDPDYYALATARLEAVKSQISIFDESEPTEKWEQANFI
jgi:site-specific DNA-methyltransferase (adenine-specific)